MSIRSTCKRFFLSIFINFEFYRYSIKIDRFLVDSMYDFDGSKKIKFISHFTGYRNIQENVQRNATISYFSQKFVHKTRDPPNFHNDCRFCERMKYKLNGCEMVEIISDPRTRGFAMIRNIRQETCTRMFLPGITRP